MTRIELTSRVGPDGVLTVKVPIGQADANREVRVTVESAGPEPMTREEWARFIDETAGSIPDLRREDQGEFEDRGELFP